MDFFLPKKGKNRLTKIAQADKIANFLEMSFSLFRYMMNKIIASPEIFQVKNCNRQTNSMTPYTGVWGVFDSVKFATSLLALLAGE